MVAFSAATFAALLLACLGNAQDIHLAVATPKPVPTWPSYAARDYLKTGHPKLNASEKARIRYMLTRVKLCQRRYLRYAFTSARQPWFIMFFGPTGSGFPHVLGEDNLYYDPTSESLPP